jgi:uroporphyrinogen decarboxylase
MGSQLEVTNTFRRALAGEAQDVPPIWLMRQAGRYHRPYQALRQKHRFEDLCRRPELAAEVAMGPIRDFDFDAAILFSDLLFPLEALGMSLSYDEGPPKLDGPLDGERIARFRSLEDAVPRLRFQADAIELTRRILPAEKGLIGFVGGPWTLFVYAMEGSHAGAMRVAKSSWQLYRQFAARMVPLLRANIAQQLEAGADVVMVLDTAAGELPPAYFDREVAPGLVDLARTFPGRLGYYAKGRAPLAVHARDDGGAVGRNRRGLAVGPCRRPCATGPRWVRARQFRSCVAVPAARRSRRRDRAVPGTDTRARVQSTARLDLRARSRCPAGHARSGGPHLRHFGQRSIRMTTLSLTQLLEKYDVPVPRYTSYPAVPNWQETPAASVWFDGLNVALAPDSSSLALYVHLPFCETLCTFCGCNTVITRNHERSAPYVQTVLAELDLYLSNVPALATRPVSQIHLGGGTPTFMPPDVLSMLLKGIAARLPLRAEGFEGSVEVDPRVTTRAHLDAMRALGISRISLGVQDFDSEVLRPGQPSPAF